LYSLLRTPAATRGSYVCRTPLNSWLNRAQSVDVKAAMAVQHSQVFVVLIVLGAVQVKQQTVACITL
jgi:hypothetical protein